MMSAPYNPPVSGDSYTMKVSESIPRKSAASTKTTPATTQKSDAKTLNNCDSSAYSKSLSLERKARVRVKRRQLKISQSRDRKHSFEAAEAQIATSAPLQPLHSPNSLVEEFVIRKGIAQMMSMTHKIDPKLESNLASVVESLSSIASIGVQHRIGADEQRRIDKMSEAVKSLSTVNVNVAGIDSIDSLITVIRDKIPDTVALCFIVYLLYTVRPPTVLGKIAFYATMTTFATAWFNYETLVTLFKSITPSFGATAELVSDSKEISTVITGVLNTCVFASSKGNFSVDKVTSLISTLSRTKFAVEPIVETVGVICEFVRQHIISYFSNSNDLTYVVTGKEYLDDWNKEVALLRSEHDSHDLVAMQTSLDRVKKAITRGKELLIRLGGSHDVWPYRTIVLDSIHKLEKIHTELVATNFKFSGVRQEPTAVLLRGIPGCGKSASMQHLAHAMAARTFEQKDFEIYKSSPSSFIFNRAAETKHWDGYDVNKRFCYFDDLLQARDVAGVPENEVLECIRAINTFENSLRCAAMDLKGNAVFRSAFVIGNTNMQNYDLIQSIHDKRAFLRRWTLVFDVCPRPEFAKNPQAGVWDRELDVTKTTEGLHPDQLEFHLQELHGIVYKPATMRACTFQEVVELCVKQTNTKKYWYEKYLQSLDQTLETYRFAIVEEIQMEDVEKLGVSQGPDYKGKMPANVSRVEKVDPAIDQAMWMARMQGQACYEFVYCSIERFRLELQIATRHTYTFNNIAVVVTYPIVFDALMDIYKAQKDDGDFDLDDAVLLICEAYHDWKTDNEQESTFNKYYRKSSEALSKMLEIAVKSGNVSYEIIRKMYHGTCWFLRGELYKQSFKFLQASGIMPVSDRMIDIMTMTSTGVQNGFIIKWLLTFVTYRMNELFKTAPTGPLSGLLTFEDKAKLTNQSTDGKNDRNIADSDFYGLVKIKFAISPKRIPEWVAAQSYYRPDQDWEKRNLVLNWVAKNEAYIVPGQELVEKWIDLSYGVVSDIGEKENQIKMDEFIHCCDGFCEIPTEKQNIEEFINNIHFGTAQSYVRAEKMPHARVVRRPDPRLKTLDVVGTSQVATAESLQYTNVNVRELIFSTARNNSFQVFLPVPEYDRVEGKSFYKRSGFMQAISGRTLIMPYHFFSYLQMLLCEKRIGPMELIKIVRTRAARDTFECPAIHFANRYCIQDPILEQSDLIVVKLPKFFQPNRDITKHFITTDQVGLYGKVESVLSLPFYSVDDKGETEFKELMPVTSTFCSVPYPFEMPRDPREPDGFYEGYNVRNTWIYKTVTSGGDCGALLMANDNKLGPKIIGMHIGADRGAGISTCLTFEMVKHALFVAGEDYAFEERLNVPIIPTEVVRENVTVIGAVSQGAYPSSNGKSSIIKSPLWGKWRKPVKKPAKLKPFLKDGEVIRPMDVARSAYCTPDVYISGESLAAAGRSVYDWLMSSSNAPAHKRVLTFEQGVLGDGSMAFGPIPRTTSAGYPYSVMKGIKTKARFFGTLENYTLTGEECGKLKDDVALIISSAERGIRLDHYFTDNMKDELRSIEKSNSGKTRLFSATPTPLLIVMRMYFGAFQRWIMENGIANGIGVGINEYSTDWDMCARYLNTFGPGHKNMGAGDFKGFDKNQIPRIHEVILAIINEWYGDEDPVANKVREILWYEVTNSLHINENLVVSWASAMASGLALTLLINCIYNMILFRLCWIAIFKFIDDFNEHCRLLVTGDDNNHSVSALYQNEFTESRLAIEMKKLGQTYTPENKGGTFDNSLRTIYEITYLKRHYVWDANYRRFIAPLDLDTILEIPFWCRNGATIMFDTQTNVAGALEELSLHTREVFDHWCPKILQAVSEVSDISIPPNTQQDILRRRVLSRGDVESAAVFGFLSDVKVNSVPMRHIYRAPLHLGVTPTWGSLVFSHFKSYNVPDYAGGMGWDIATDHSRIPESGYDSSDGNTETWPYDRRGGIIESYYQDLPRAIPSSSRGRGIVPATAQVGTETRATDSQSTTINNVTDAAPIGLNASSSIASNRTADNAASFLPSSTTQSTNDAETTKASMLLPSRVPAGLTGQALTGVSSEIRDFLSKPIIAASTVFSTSDTITTNIATLFVPFTLFNSGIIYTHKLEGNFLWRAKTVFTLIINGNRFQQGRYLMAWVPDGGGSNNATNNETVWTAGHSASLVQRTQLPHVELDVACDTQAVLEIPWTNATGWWPWSPSTIPLYSNNGLLIIRAYSPLVAPTGSTVVNGVLYVHFEDIEFGLPAIPQMSGRANGKVVRHKRVQELEAMDDGVQGPVSGFLEKISQSANLLTGIPLISSVAETVGWATDISANIAKIFGWSKPHDSSHPMSVARYVIPKYTNTDSPDTGTKLSLFQSANVEDISGFAGTDMDEMAINYIASIPAWFQTITWSEGSTEGAVLGTFVMAPNTFAVSATYGTNTIYFCPPVTYISRFFSHWRGSLKLTFKIVKTEFHSGRLMVSFWPFDYSTQNGTQNTFDNTNSAWVHRNIIDIRSGNEAVFLIPWNGMLQYRTLFGADSSFGTVYLTVLNPLVAPSSVSSSVSILCEISGGPDLEFAFPRSWSDSIVYPAVAQIGTENVCEIISAEIGNSSVSNTLIPARAAMGERILSLRSLVKRFTQMNTPLITPVTTGHPYAVIQPYQLANSYINTGNTLSNPTNSNDILGAVLHMFCLYRGGVRMKLIDTVGEDVVVNAQQIPLGLANPIVSSNATYVYASSTQVGNSGSFQLGNGNASAFTRTGISSAVEFEVPYYNRTFATATCDSLQNDGLLSSTAYNVNGTVPRQAILISFPITLPTGGINVLRAAADDFSCGLFISCPALSTNPTYP